MSGDKFDTDVLRRRARAQKNVSISRGQLQAIADEIDRLRSLLVEADDAFSDCTGDYAEELTAGEGWREQAAAIRGMS